MAATVKVRYRRPADRRSRPQRWRDAVAELIELQADHQQWLIERYGFRPPAAIRAVQLPPTALAA